MKALFLAGFMGLFLLSPPSHADGSKTIIWAATELPGVFGLSAQQENPQLEGLVGAVQNYLLDGLPDDFSLQPVSMLIPRIEREMQSGDNVCTGILLRTAERERYLNFSRPYMVIPTPQVAMTANGWETLGRPQQIELSELLNHPELRGMRVNHRSYGGFIDQQLDAATNLNMTVTGSTNAMRMLAGGRADFLIEYPVVIAQLLADRADQLHFVTISGTAPFLNLAISCSQSELGSAFIAAVDARLPSLVQDPVYLQLNLELAPRQLRAELSEVYHRQVMSAEP
ncbi:transporter substrate-binding domain-containing protein [Saccharospirillum sp. HFRX-1]|uniref:hypothetical protein n=1 Tax=unclassified Saccharospirillum TaxID=2633430 RepID=UPI0037101EDB